MAIVADFAWTKPTVAQLDSWGAVAVGMYCSHDASKNATPELVRTYASAGIKTFLFFEDAAGNPLGGASQGEADAAFAREQAAALGKPDWAPIVASVDIDLPDYAPKSSDPMAKLGPAGEYFQAWDEKLGLPETGGYGGYYVISRLAAAKLISVGVQTIAWSGGLVDTPHIAALQNGRLLDGGNVDVEVIESGNLLDRLAWVPGEAAPGAVPAVPPHPADGNWLCRGMDPLVKLATGTLHATPAVVLATTLKHNNGTFPAGLGAYLNGGNLAAAKIPAGVVLWYPRAA